MKDPADRHRLVIDEYAANVVRDIFRWKLKGISTGDIADRLNKAGIPTPMDYKHSQGMRYSTSFRVKAESVWSVAMVLRILKNPVYIGNLEQGRVTTPSYKVKRVVNKPREEWAVVEGCHEPVIDRQDFDIIQKVLALDTRTSIGSEAVELFSGLVYCGECGAAMVRKTVPSGKKKYVYHICAAHKNEKTCSAHSLRDIALEEIVLEVLKKHIQDVIDLSELLEMTDVAQLQKAGMRKLRDRLAQKEAEIDRCQTLLLSLYENLTDGVIDQAEYRDLKKTYARRKAEAEEQAEAIREEMIRDTGNGVENRGWIEQFRCRKNITTLDRAIVVSLIEQILIYRKQRVKIVFRWHNEFKCCIDLLSQTQQTGFQEEAI